MAPETFVEKIEIPIHFLSFIVRDWTASAENTPSKGTENICGLSSWTTSY